MDPNEALKQARKAAAVLAKDPADLDHGYDYEEQEQREDAADDLRDSFQALDSWLSKGGFLPDPWTNGGPRL